MASLRGFARQDRTPIDGRKSPLLPMQLLVAVVVVALPAPPQAVSAQYCDLAVGSWQRPTAPLLYTGTSCPFAAKSPFKCATDAAANYTWVTSQCVLPSFNATVFMQRLYNKSMAIVGDSLADNHWIGLRCAIHTVLPTVDVKLTWIKAKYMAFSVPSHKATIIYMSDPYLVDKPTSPLMKINPLWTAAAMKIDYIVINFGHWYRKKKLSNMAAVIQMRLATRTICTFLQSMYKGTAVFATYLPTHPGTFCKSKIVLNATQFAAAAPIELGTLIRNAEVEELRLFPSVRLLDITPVSFWRGDAHPGNECSHWCVPGVVDTWSAMLDYVIANPPATAAAHTRILA